MLKAIALAVFLAGTPAAADTLVLHCGSRDCAEARCDNWGENCVTVATFRQARNGKLLPLHFVYVCDEFHDCRFAPPPNARS